MSSQPTSSQLFDLTGKVAIVTGGNGGLGLGIALGLAGAGADIVVAARDPVKTAAAMLQIEDLGRRALSLVVDVSHEAAIQRMATDAAASMGRIDILVNNAGIAARAAPQDLATETWDKVVDVNLRAAFLASREVYPHLMKRGGGKIINVGSMYSLFGSDISAPYAASKAGLVQLTKSLAAAWAKDNIQVNAILPGWFVTDLTSGIPRSDPERYDNINRRIPTGRWGEPAELTGAAVLLASRGSDYITGASIVVDGGYSSV